MTFVDVCPKRVYAYEVKVLQAQAVVRAYCI